MNLYEITNGYWGESYRRCYAWAESEATALQKFAVENPDYRRDGLQVNLLFSEGVDAFCTRMSDSGWDADVPNGRCVSMHQVDIGASVRPIGKSVLVIQEGE